MVWGVQDGLIYLCGILAGTAGRQGSAGRFMLLWNLRSLHVVSPAGSHISYMLSEGFVTPKQKLEVLLDAKAQTGVVRGVI